MRKEKERSIEVVDNLITDSKVSKELWLEIDFALEKEKISLFNAAINKLELMDNISDEANYLLGYLYYLHPDASKKIEYKSKSKKYLNKTLAISEDKSIIACCNLYLGHLLYDNLHFKQALHYFEKADISALNSKYLQLKVYEFRLCSRINLNGLKKSLKDLEDFITVINAYPVYDISPEGLLILLSHTRENLDKKNLHKLQTLLDQLDNIAQFDWFTELTKEIVSVSFE